MTPSLKPCSVLLNRVVLDSIGSIKINNVSMVERKNSDYSYDSKNSGSKALPSEVNHGIHDRLRRKEKIGYSEESQNSRGETSDSEFSELSDDEETDQVIKGKPKINCNHCDKSFSTYPSYLTHKRSHQLRQFKCILCMKTNKYRQSHIGHMKRLHPEVEPFHCEYQSCEQSFRTQYLLRVHNKSHLRYMCKFCKKLFAKKHYMRKHVLKFH